MWVKKGFSEPVTSDMRLEGQEGDSQGKTWREAVSARALR